MKLLFCGDFAPIGRFEKLVIENKNAIFGDALKLIQDADISFVNLECPLTYSNGPIHKEGPAIKADPNCIDALKNFTIAGLANNHILDYGDKGLADTIELCKNNSILYTGAGLSYDEAIKPAFLTRNGIKFAIIALSEEEFNQSSPGNSGSAPIDPIINYKQISYAKTNADIVIITLHAGTEFFPLPNPFVQRICRHYAELGVHAIICHHPHVPSGYEVYNDVPIFYSIGNFLFDSKNDLDDWGLGYMVEFLINEDNKAIEKFSIIGFKQNVSIKGLHLLHGDEKKQFQLKIEHLNASIADSSILKAQWDDFIMKNSSKHLLKAFSPYLGTGVRLLSKIFPIEKFCINNTNILSKINLIRCQSHREFLLRALELKAKYLNKNTSS
jgi:poly-gamma-glutamate capsule biosynthesis protein CapA/YwtB (metallophosphatase superfamily)